MLNGNGKLSSVSTTNVCRRDGDVLLRTNTLQKMSYTQEFLYINTTTIYVNSMGISLIFAFPLVISSKNALPHSIACNVSYFCGGVFEQLARYTMRYQESDLHLGLYSSLTSANNLNLPTLLTLFYFSTLLYSSILSSTFSYQLLIFQFKYSSGFYSKSWTCLGLLTEDMQKSFY